MKESVGRDHAPDADRESATSERLPGWERDHSSRAGLGMGASDPDDSRQVFRRMGAAIERGTAQARFGSRALPSLDDWPLQRRPHPGRVYDTALDRHDQPIQRLVMPDAKGDTLPERGGGVVQRLQLQDELVANEYYQIELPDKTAIGLYLQADVEGEVTTYHFLDFYSGASIELDTTEQYAEVVVTHIPDTDVVEVAQDMVLEDDAGPEDAVPFVPAEALKFQVMGINVGQELAALAEKKEVGVIQAKFLGGAFNAPVNAWVLMTAPHGAGANPGANPPGWVGGAHPNHHQRGHLIGKQFGGGGGLNNLVTLSDGTNHPAMTAIENPLAKLVTASPGNVFLYVVQPNYNPAFIKKNTAGATVVQHPAPASVTMYAKNMTTGALITFVVINNGLLQNHAACKD